MTDSILTRAGLPPDEAPGTFIGWDAEGIPHLLRWADNGTDPPGWYALGFEPCSYLPWFRPVAFFGNAVLTGERALVRHIQLPT